MYSRRIDSAFLFRLSILAALPLFQLVKLKCFFYSEIVLHNSKPVRVIDIYDFSVHGFREKLRVAVRRYEEVRNHLHVLPFVKNHGSTPTIDPRTTETTFSRSSSGSEYHAAFTASSCVSVSRLFKSVAI